MKRIILVSILLISYSITHAQNPVGRWKKISHIIENGGQKIDTYEALLKQRPCADKIVYEINADGTLRLNAASSGCDDNYKKIQEKIWSKTKWQLKDNVFTMSTLPDFSIGQSYKISISGNKMTWTGTNGQGTLSFQKL